MTLGEKIKQERKRKGMTQSELCDGRITRNMLSCIENGSALPSLDTLTFIAERLSIPAGYLISNEHELGFYTRSTVIAEARAFFAAARYKECIKKLDEARIYDDEAYYLLTYSHFKLGLELFGGGTMSDAKRNLTAALEYCGKTVYDTSLIESSAPLYLTVCENASLPLLDFDEDKYLSFTFGNPHYQFYKYLVQDGDFSFSNGQYSMHLRAKRLMKERKLTEAIELLTAIEDTKKDYPPNAYLMFCVYADLESCYKNLLDFEKAYRYSSKRISMLEAFSG